MSIGAKRWLRAIAIRLALYPAIGYLILCGFLYFQQARFLFPAPKDFPRNTPAGNALPFEDLLIPVVGSDHLHAWWIPATPASARVILAFHGNGYVLEDMAGDELASLHALGANLMLVDYRGYGSSTRVTPNETTIDADADASLDYLLHGRRFPVSEIFVIGRSIGSGPATYLAQHHGNLGGLILESPFSSIDDAAASFRYFRAFPTSLLLRTHFNNVAGIGSVHTPLLVVCGSADTLTPTWMANKIFAKAHEPKQIYIVPGAGHNDLLTSGGLALDRVLQRFVSR